MSRRILLLVVALIIAAFTVMMLRNHQAQPVAEGPVTPPTPRIIVAKHDLTPGSFVQAAQDLDWGNAPVAEAPTPTPAVDANGNPVEPQPSQPQANGAATPPVDPYYREGSVKLEDFNGAIVRRPLHTGEPVSQSAILKAGTGGLMSAVLEAGKRAVSISVNTTSGNAGFVLPGDYVDLIITREITRNISNGRESETRKIIYSKIFIENVRVLAADQTLDNGENKALPAKTITVEVTPTQSQEIAVAAELGKISVSLRSAVKNESVLDPSSDMSGVTEKDMHIEPESPDVSEQVKMLRPSEVQNLEFYKSGSGL